MKRPSRRLRVSIYPLLSLRKVMLSKLLYIDAGKDAYAKAYPEKEAKAADANKV